MSSSVPFVEPAVEETIAELEGDHRVRVRLDGPPSAGKSVTLNEIASRLEEVDGRFGILVSPPAGALDAGPVALMQIGAALIDRGLAGEDDALERLKDPQRPWQSKRSLLNGWLASAAGEAVLLCDEPEQWPAKQHWHFAQAATDVVERVIFDGTGCDVVATGRISHTASITSQIALSARCDAERMLDGGGWGPLRRGAERVLEIGADRLEGHSPLQLRLLVALSMVDPERDPTVWVDRALEELASVLLERMRLKERWADLVDCWRRLARVRRPFDPELLELLGAGTLERQPLAILERCLLYEQHGNHMLHEKLRREALYGRPPEGEEALQRTLAGHYRAKFTGGTDPLSLAWEMEAYHHASKSGSLDFGEYQEFFVEQLNALGYHLSKEEGRYDAAVEAYRRALRWDEDNDYAHHYLAYNLDVKAENPAEAEEHYRRAVDLSPSHPWWHTRLVDFYAATGRFDLAREAWNAARAEFETADGDLTPHLCQELHMWVARTVLEFGQIDFCEMVLRGIPEELRPAVGGYWTVLAKMESARLARDFGNFVPGPLLERGWWEKGPFLLSREGLVQWVAGEVTESSEVGIVVEAAVIEPGEAIEKSPIAEEIEMSWAELEEWGSLEPHQVEVGDFIELVIAGAEADTRTKVAIHPRHEWIDYSLPPLQPDPGRYLR